VIAFRKKHKQLHGDSWVDGKDITWYGTQLCSPPDWDDESARSLSYTLEARTTEEKLIHIMINFYWEPLEFEVPKITGVTWTLAIDTNDPKHGTDKQIKSHLWLVMERSIVVLVSE